MTRLQRLERWIATATVGLVVVSVVSAIVFCPQVANALMLLKQATACYVQMGPFLDDGDGKTAETALTISQADVVLSKGGAAFAQKTDAEAAVHDAAGWYRARLDATDTGTLGRLLVAVAESGALPVWREFMVVPANAYDSLVAGSDYLDANAAQVEGADATDTIRDSVVDDATRIDASALNTLSGHDPGANLGTSTLTQTQVTGGAYALDTDGNGRVRIVDGAGAGEINTDSGKVVEVGTLTGHTAQSGDSFARIGAAGVGLTAVALADATSDAVIADAVWNAATATYGSADTYGVLVETDLDAAISSRSAHAAADVWAVATRKLTHLDEDDTTIDLDGTTIGTVSTLTGHTVQTGDSYARIGAAGVSLTAVALADTTSDGVIADAVWNAATVTYGSADTYGVLVETDLDAAISSRSSHTAANVWAVATRKLTHLDEDDTTIDLDGTTIGTVSTLTGHTAQTGDSYARIGAAGVSLTAVALADATSDGVIADAVWNAATATYGSADTYGVLVETDLDATVSSRSSHTAANVWAVATRALTILDEDSTTLDLDGTTIGTVTTLTGHTAQSGDSYARIGAAGVSLTAVALADTTSDGVIADAVWNAATATYGSADTYGVLVETDLDAAISSRSSHDAAAVKTAIEADGSKLDHLWEMTEDDAGTRRLTTNALEQAPTGAGTTAQQVWEYGTRTLTALDEDSTTLDLDGTTIGTVSTLTGHTAQTGDSYARIGAAGVGLTAVALADTTSDGVIADAVWNAATATYGSADTYGVLVETDLDAAISSRAASATALSTATWTNARAGYLDKLNVAGTLANTDNASSFKADLDTVPTCLLATTVATVTDQTHFTLTAGADVDDTYKHALIVLYDTSNSSYPSVRRVTAYTGATKTVTLKAAPDFTFEATDPVRIFVTRDTVITH